MMKKMLMGFAAALVILWAGTTWASPEKAENFKEIFTKGTVKGYYRAIYFTRDFDEASQTDRAVFANGGAVHLSTAPFKGLSANIGFYTVEDFGINDEDDNTEIRTLYHTDGRVVTSHGNTKGFSTLGEYFIQGKWGKTTVRVGAMEIWGRQWGTPWLHSWDFRVVPATYEGIYIQDQSIDGLKIYAAPYIWGFRENNKEDFISPAEKLTRNSDDDGGISFLGLTYKKINNLKLQGWYHHFHDVFDNKLFMADYTPKITKDLNLILKGEYLFQDDVGDSLLGDHEATSYGATIGLKGYGLTLEGLYQTVTDDGDLKDFIGSFMYTNNVISAGCNTVGKADLEAYGIHIGYNFGYLTPSLKGLTADLRYTNHDYPDSGALAEADIDELQLDFKYKFSGNLKGLSARARWIWFDQDVNQGGVGESLSTRFYLEYRF